MVFGTLSSIKKMGNCGERIFNYMEREWDIESYAMVTEFIF